MEVDYREFLPVGWDNRRTTTMPGGRGWQAADEDLLCFRGSRTDGGVFTLTLLAPAVERAITAALAPMKTDFRRLQMGAGDLDEWLDPTGAAMVAGKRMQEGVRGPPDVVLPIHSRFGTWEIRSWDLRTRFVEHDAGVQMVAAIVSLLLMLGGGGLFLGRQKALRLAEQRVSFVNRVSHELRTPLTNLILNLDLMADDEGSAADSNPRMKLVREEAGRLSRLVENVLTFARREEGRVNLSIASIDLEPRVRRCAEAFGPLLRRRGVEISVRCPTPVLAEADPDAFEQILGNLLSNVEK